METKEQTNQQKPNTTKKKRPKEDILEVVKQFITYFEEIDRSKKR